MFYTLIVISIVSYFILSYLIKSIIYKRDTKKRDITILNLQIVVVSLILNFVLELFGIHNKWLIDFVIAISAIIVSYNLATWFIFKKYSTEKETNRHIKEEDDDYSDIYDNIVKNKIDGEFSFNNKRYLTKSDKIWQIEKTYKSNKTTRLYDMFLILCIFFFALLYLAVILDGVIKKDSMAYGVVLLFGAAFILPYLQDFKHTIRFAKNPHLSFDSYVSFWLNDKEIFGKIIDMNIYEIMLFRRFSKDYVTISHSEIKTFTTYENGKRFKKLYIVSKKIKYYLETNFRIWLIEFNKDNNDCLDLETLEIFFTTEDDDHGIELNIFIKQEFLENYTLIIKNLMSFIQKEADNNGWSLETPRRHDIKIISDDIKSKFEKELK